MKGMIKKIVGFAAMSLVMGKAIAASPIGYIDQVVKEGSLIRVKGWACQPGYNGAIKVRLYLNNQSSSSLITTAVPSEAAIHDRCGTSSAKHRFTLIVPFGTSYSGQKVRVDAVGVSNQTASITGSNTFHLPMNNQTPDKVFSAAQRILLFVGHQDDEILFSPFLGRYCESKTCKIISATNDPVRVYEWPAAMAKFPAQSAVASLASPMPNAKPSQVLSAWDQQLAAMGATTNSAVAVEIDKFRPDVILTLDPRHGTSCHPTHRAIGEAVRKGVAAYSGAHFADKTKLYFLTTRRIDYVEHTPTGSHGILGLVPSAPKDPTSVVYSGNDWLSSSKGSGWNFAATLVKVYGSQFTDADHARVLAAPELERTTAFQRVTDYVASDTDYTRGDLRDPRMLKCSSW